MNFPSLEIQGSIITTEILSRIRIEQAKYQQGKDFNKDLTNAKLKDEISFAWQEAKGQWTIFQSKLARLKAGQSGTTETRNFWVQPLLSNLGYNLVFSKSAEEVGGKQFQIGFKDSDLDGFPVYIGSFFDSLDKPPQNKQLKTSAHAMLQEYLNYNENSLYGLVTNGKQIRLLRDATRITRLSYVEFNLEKMMEEDLYSDFVIFYRLLHSSRMKKQFDDSSESIIEKYHQESLEAGSTIRNKLGIAVKQAIESLGQEFINHPLNTSLREAIKDNKVNIDEFYKHQLRIIYRLLFLFVIEERNLVFGESKSPELKHFNKIYFDYYSLLRLRKLAKKLPPPDANRHYDLWLSLLNTFALFENKTVGEKLGIMSLEGDLFSYDAIASSGYDLHKCYLNNAPLLRIIKSLTYFENENKVLIPVNYGGLDVEEFGSVYEGLLELKLSINRIEGSENYNCSFESSSERSQSGSHYTPEELVQPLIKHSLEYIIEDKLKTSPLAKGGTQGGSEKEAKLQSLLSIKVCDVACGSGHILLSAARRISLEYARIDTGEEQPNPTAIRKAMRAVISNCIYGVDKNPLAVELCKVALWLEAHNPGMPLNFLDHKIKCGDSIVGLARIEELQNGIATEAFKTLPGDDKDIAASFRKRNKTERENRAQLKLTDTEEIINNLNWISVKFKNFNLLPDTTVDEVKKKQQEYNLLKGSDWMKLKELADIQTAQFFIDKTNTNKEFLTTDAEYFRIFAGQKKEVNTRKISHAMAVAVEKRFFHWFLEFPEVMQDGGFDCIVGNPPFLGGSSISTNYGDSYLNYVLDAFTLSKGLADYVSYFFRLIFKILNEQGFFSLISTNTISQGATRESSLKYIVDNGGEIVFAIKSIRWPGRAAVEVSLISISKKGKKVKKYLGYKIVDFISTYLDDSFDIGDPEILWQNANKCFVGSYPLGTGFLLEINEANRIMNTDKKYSDVLKPYLNGDDINNDIAQKASRYIINFYNWPENYCKDNYPICYDIIFSTVREERQSQKVKSLREKWWIYKRPTEKLYESIKKYQSVLVFAQTTKYILPIFTKSNQIFSIKCIVSNLIDYSNFSILQTSFYNEWVWKYGTTMGSSTLQFAVELCFETFPFPQNLTKETEAELEKIGEEYHEFRRQLMLDMQLGLTKTYNLFHNPEVRSQKSEEAKNIKEFKSANLQIPIEEAIQRIEKLRALHKQMDEAVLKAYGWGFDSAQPENVIAIPTGREKQSQPPIDLEHNFYEVDYLPENDRVRYTISPEARKEILKRLLELNHKIHAEEVAKGLWEKGKSKKNKTSVVKEQQEKYGQGGLFGE